MENYSSISQKAFIPDEPEIENDYFNRKTFSQRIVNTIVLRDEPSSIVVGIYGEWGTGKTTVLNYIETQLKNYNTIICIRYNPWYYSNEVMLLQNFFNVLVEKLTTVSSNNGLKTKVKKYGKQISKFASSKSATINFGPVKFDPFSSNSYLDLSKSKKEIQEALRIQNIRIVVIMDDIDRLDKIEIQAIFKLIKLSADFNFLDYILAFDEKMVASAVGEKYGSSNVESGREFLEKIINVPLNLPQASEISLFNFLCEGISNNVLPIIKPEIQQEVYTTFTEQVRKGILIRLKTPRMAKRYQNALIFALPLLGDEVNVVDLMLIEGIRIFYPEMYNALKYNARLFLNLDTSYDKSEIPKAEISVKLPGKITDILNNLSSKERQSLHILLDYLFPEIKVLNASTYSYFPVANQLEIQEKKRMASLQYFNRFFSYAIQTDDMSDFKS